jgi:hypothetical protein
LVIPIELKNNAELTAKFVTKIDGEFWIEIRYTRDFHTSRDHPVALTEFSATYVIKEGDKTIQNGGFSSHASVPALVSRPYYAPELGRLAARKDAEYEIIVKLGSDIPNGLPKSATVEIFLDPRVP